MEFPYHEIRDGRQGRSLGLYLHPLFFPFQLHEMTTILYCSKIEERQEEAQRDSLLNNEKGSPSCFLERGGSRGRV